jgi:hypothetical protein
MHIAFTHRIMRMLDTRDMNYDTKGHSAMSSIGQHRVFSSMSLYEYMYENMITKINSDILRKHPASGRVWCTYYV